MPDDKIRPTKKQRELLGFIDTFTIEHGYSPSYREIMKGLGYTSVATVALHVNSLVNRGHLRKRGRSARSLEVREIGSLVEKEGGGEKWLVDRIESYLTSLEKCSTVDAVKLDEAYVLVNTLRILGLDEAAKSFMPRLTALRAI